MPVEKAPFSQQGSLLHYERDVPWGTGADWRPNEPFEATLTLARISRGRSAAYFVWEDEEGRTFPMFMSNVADLIKGGISVVNGTVTGRWDVVKKGQNYGIRALPKEGD